MQILKIAFITTIALISLAGSSSATFGGEFCTICTCENEAVICLSTMTTLEITEEQGPCGGVCASVNSSFESIEVVEAACEDLPTCDHAEAPAASPLWLAGGAVALLMLGSATLKRIRSRTASA